MTRNSSLPDREFPEYIPAQEHPVGSMAWIISPLNNREKLIILAYYLGGMKPHEIAAQLSRYPNKKGAPSATTIRRYIRAGRSKIYSNDIIKELVNAGCL